MNILSSAFHIWFDAVRATVPGWLYLPGLMGTPAQVLTVKDLENVSSDGEITFNKGDVLDVRIDPFCFLQREVLIPRNAQKKSQSILELQLRQSMPAKGDGLVWRAFKAGTQANNVRFMQLVLKHTKLEKLTLEIESLGGRVRTIGIAGHDNFAPLTDNRKRLDFVPRLWGAVTIGLAAISIGMFFLTSFTSMAALETEVAVLQSGVDATRLEVLAARKHTEESSETFAEISADIELLFAQSGRLEVLYDLTRSLPDDVWTSEITFSSQKVHLSGFSKIAVPDVIDLIAAHDWAARVDLDGPVSFDRRTQQHRFELNIQLNGIETK